MQVKSRIYNTGGAKNIIVLILAFVIIDALVQGFFINQIDFISPQDAGLLNFAKQLVSPKPLTESEMELMAYARNHTPLYPFLCGIIYLITGDLDGAPAICYVIFSAALIIPVFLISLRIYGKETAIIVSMLLIFIPALSITIFYSIRHVVYNFFLYLGLYFVLIAYLDKKIKHYGLGGLFLGLAYLTRGEGLLIFISILCLMAVTLFFFEKKQETGKLKIFIVLIFSFLVGLSPHMLTIYNSTGNISCKFIGGDTNYKYYAFTTGQGVVDELKGDTDELMAYGFEVYGSDVENNNSILNAIKRNPKAYASRVIKNFKNLLVALPSTLLIPFFLYPFMGLAFIELLRNGDQLKASLLFFSVIATYVLLLTMVFYIQVKLFTPIVPIMLIWVAYGIKRTQDVVRGEGFLRFSYVPSAAAILPIAIIFFLYIPSLSSAIPRETKEIGLWIKANSLPSDMVVVPQKWYDEKLYLQYYSGRKVRKEKLRDLDFFKKRQNADPIIIAKKGESFSLTGEVMPILLKVFTVNNKKIAVYEAF